MNSKILLAIGVCIVILFGALSALTRQPYAYKASTQKELVQEP